MRRTGEVVRLSKLLTVTCLVCAHCPIVSVCCRTVWGIIGNTVSVNPIHLINTLWSSQDSYQHIFATFPATTGPLQACYAPWMPADDVTKGPFFVNPTMGIKGAYMSQACHTGLCLQSSSRSASGIFRVLMAIDWYVWLCPSLPLHKYTAAGGGGGISACLTPRKKKNPKGNKQKFTVFFWTW